MNEVACHAIPDDRPLQDGDIVSFDVSVFLKARHFFRSCLDTAGGPENRALLVILHFLYIFQLFVHSPRTPFPFTEIFSFSILSQHVSSSAFMWTNQGFHGDNCATVGVGKVDDAAHRLMDATKVYNIHIYIYIYATCYLAAPLVTANDKSCKEGLLEAVRLPHPKISRVVHAVYCNGLLNRSLGFRNRRPYRVVP